MNRDIKMYAIEIRFTVRVFSHGGWDEKFLKQTSSFTVLSWLIDLNQNAKLEWSALITRTAFFFIFSKYTFRRLRNVRWEKKPEEENVKRGRNVSSLLIYLPSALITRVTIISYWRSIFARKNILQKESSEKFHAWSFFFEWRRL